MSNGKKKNGNNHRQENYRPSPSQRKDLKDQIEETNKIYEEDSPYKPKIYLTPEKWIVALGLIVAYVSFTVGYILRNTLFTIH